MHKKFRDLRHSIEQHSSRDDNNLLVVVVEVLCTYLCSYTCPQYEAKQAGKGGMVNGGANVNIQKQKSFTE